MARKIGKDKRYIQNLSRAINKIDDRLSETYLVAVHEIAEVKMGINDLSYTVDGKKRKVRYDEINRLSESEQASLWGRLAYERTKTREKVALQQLKEKGEISKPFLRSIKDKDKKLWENIDEFIKITRQVDENSWVSFNKEQYKNYKDRIKGMFDMDFKDVESELDDFFQVESREKGVSITDIQFDFYRPGQAGGFTELNTFTMNAYRALRS